MFVLLSLFLKVQEKINLSCGDPEVTGNDRLPKANWAWIVAGGVLWVLIIAGVLMPDDP